MKKKIFSILLCITVMMCSAAGCGQGKKPSDKSNESDSNSVTEENSLTEASKGELDWNEAKKDITFDGKKIDFPFSVNDLGDDYKMSYIYDSAFGDKCCDGEVVKINPDGSESTACYLTFYDLTADEYTDDTKCTEIRSRKPLTVQGIGEGSSLEDAEKLWGKPYKQDKVFAFYLSKSGTERIALKYDTETNKVESLYITLNFKEEWL